MKNFIKLLIISSVMIIGGCSILENSRVHERVIDVINSYCTNVSEDERLIIRRSINENSPHNIEITCN